MPSSVEVIVPSPSEESYLLEAQMSVGYLLLSKREKASLNSLDVLDDRKSVLTTNRKPAL